jgi:hypothetical protein
VVAGVRAVDDAGHDTWRGGEFKKSRGTGDLGKALPRAARVRGRRGSGAGAGVAQTCRTGNV